jgi:hypothetical protein
VNRSFYVLSGFLILFNSFHSFASDPSTLEKLLPIGVDSAIVTNPYTGERGDVRKGTIGASIQNIALLNKLFEQSNSSDQPIDEIVSEIRKLIPSLKVLGMFDIFNHEEWLNISLSKQWGRVTCVLLYFEKYPAEIDSRIKSQILLLKEKDAPKALLKLINSLKLK